MTPEAHGRDRLLRWMALGTDLFATELGLMKDQQIIGPSTLPGWRNAHLLTHVARNADALANLARWASTGIETPMYPGGSEQRLADIASGASRTAREIRLDIAESAERLQKLLDDMPSTAWTAVVRTGQGRLVPAALIPWLRIREVWIHRVDLNPSLGFDAVPDELAALLLTDVVETLASRSGCPAVAVHPDGDELTLTTRPEEPRPTTVAGTPAALIGWLTGRASGVDLKHSGTALPTLPAWL